MARSRLFCAFLSFGALAVVSFFFLLPSDIPGHFDDPTPLNDQLAKAAAVAKAAQKYDADGSLSFRERIAHVGLFDSVPHSRTFGLSEIVVISLPHRSDRQARMSLLARALDADFKFFNGTPSASPEVARILEHVRVQREREGVLLQPSSDAGRRGPGEPAPQDSPSYPFDALALQAKPDISNLAGSDVWSLPPDDPRAPQPPLPPAPVPDHRPRIHQIMETLKRTHWWMGEANLPFEEVSPSVVACWHAHYSLIKQWAAKDGEDDDTMLIMEDDVDIEFGFEATLRRAMAGLPNDWDVLLPGYCDSTETKHRPVAGFPRLRPSDRPLCNHGYVVSRRGARRLVAHLRSPSFSYSRPLDQAYQWLIMEKLLKFYSITPVQIVQEHKLGSDIRGGTGAGWWDDDLEDSSLARAQLLLEKDPNA